MNRDLMFGGPAATGAVVAPVDPGWARRQEALGLSSDTSVPPAASSASAASLAASKRDAVWEAKRQKRMASQGGGAEPAFPQHSAMSVAPEPPTLASFAAHTGVMLPQTQGLSRLPSPAPVVQFQPAPLPAAVQPFRPAPSVEPAGRSPAEYSTPVVDAKALAAAQKAAYSSALEAQMEAKRQQEIAHKQRAKEEAGMQYGFLANAVGEVEKNGGLAPRSFSPLRVRDPEPPVDQYLPPSAAAPVDPRAHRAAAAEEYARQLEYQMKQKQQLQAQQRQVEKLTAQQSAGIADIIGSSNSHQRTMAQVQQNIRSNPPPAPDALDVLRRENERQRPASAMDAYASRAEPSGWGETNRRGSFGTSALARAGAFAVEAETRGEHEYRRVQSAKPDAHHAAMRAAAERNNAHDTSKPFHSPKDTYAEELRQQMAEKEARKRREKAISLAPAHIPTSRHAQRTEETNSRAVYLTSIGVDPSRPSPPAYEQPSDFFSSSPPPGRGSHANQWNPSPVTHDRPVLSSMPSAAPYSQYPAPAPPSFMPQYAGPQAPIQPSYTAQAQAQPQYNAPPPQSQYNAYGQPPPPQPQSSYPSFPPQQAFNNGYPGPPPLQQYGSSSPPPKQGGFGDPEQAKRMEEARRREQYAIELENQIKEAQIRKDLEKRRQKDDDWRLDKEIQEYEQRTAARRMAFDPMGRGGGTSAPASSLPPSSAVQAVPWEHAESGPPPVSAAREGFARAASDIRPGLEPEWQARKARLQTEAAAALEAQIEEKARRKQEEKSRRKTEEAEEEQRLARERGLLAQRFEAEETGAKLTQEEETRNALDAQIQAKRRQKELEVERQRLESAKDEARVQKQQQELQRQFAREQARERGHALTPEPVSPMITERGRSLSPVPAGVSSRADLFAPRNDSSLRPLPVTQSAMDQMQTAPPAQMPSAPGMYPPMYMMPGMMAAPMMAAPWGQQMAQPFMPFPMAYPDMRPGTSVATKSKLEAHEGELNKLKDELAAVRQQASDTRFLKTVEETNKMIMQHGPLSPERTRPVGQPQPSVSFSPRQLFDSSFDDGHHIYQEVTELPGFLPNAVTATRSMDPLMASMRGESRFIFPGATTGGGGMTKSDREDARVEGQLLPTSSTFEDGFGDTRSNAHSLRTSSRSSNNLLMHVTDSGSVPIHGRSRTSSENMSSNAPSTRPVSPLVPGFSPEEDVINAIDGLLRQGSKQATRAPVSDANTAIESLLEQSLLDASFAPADFMRVSAMLPDGLRSTAQRPWNEYGAFNPQTQQVAPIDPRHALDRPLDPYHTSERPSSVSSAVSATPSDIHPSAQVTRELQNRRRLPHIEEEAHDPRPPRGVRWAGSDSEGSSSASGSSDGSRHRRKSTHRKEKKRRSRSSSSESSASERRSRKKERSSKDSRSRGESKSRRKSSKERSSRRVRTSEADPAPATDASRRADARFDAVASTSGRVGGPVVLQRGPGPELLKELGRHAGKLDGDTRWLQ